MKIIFWLAILGFIFVVAGIIFDEYGKSDDTDYDDYIGI